MDGCRPRCVYDVWLLRPVFLSDSGSSAPVPLKPGRQSLEFSVEAKSGGFPFCSYGSQRILYCAGRANAGTRRSSEQRLVEAGRLQTMVQQDRRSRSLRSLLTRGLRKLGCMGVEWLLTVR